MLILKVKSLVLLQIPILHVLILMLLYSCQQSGDSTPSPLYTDFFFLFPLYSILYHFWVHYIVLHSNTTFFSSPLNKINRCKQLLILIVSYLKHRLLLKYFSFILSGLHTPNITNWMDSIWYLFVPMTRATEQKIGKLKPFITQILPHTDQRYCSVPLNTHIIHTVKHTNRLDV